MSKLRRRSVHDGPPGGFAFGMGAASAATSFLSACSGDGRVDFGKQRRIHGSLATVTVGLEVAAPAAAAADRLWLPHSASSFSAALRVSRALMDVLRGCDRHPVTPGRAAVSSFMTPNMKRKGEPGGARVAMVYGMVGVGLRYLLVVGLTTRTS